MPSFSKNDVVLVAYPFSDRSGVKVRPASRCRSNSRLWCDTSRSPWVGYLS
jgi:hypothetical protein